MITQARAEQAAHDADILATQILTARGGNKKKLIQKRAGLLAVVTRYNRQPVAAAPASVAEKKTCCGGKCTKKKAAAEQAMKTLADISEAKQLANIAEAQRVLDTLYSEIVQQAADMVNNGASKAVTDALDKLLSTFTVYANDVDEDDIADDEEIIDEEDDAAKEEQDHLSLCEALRSLANIIVKNNGQEALKPLSAEWNPKLYAGNKLFKVASVRIV